MAQKAISAAFLALVMIVSVPAMVTAGVPASQSTSDEADSTVVVQNAQVQTLELDNATINNVTIQVLVIDRVQVENETENGSLNETLNESGTQDRTVLRNVTFENLSLEGASAEGIELSQQQSGPTGPGVGQSEGDEPTAGDGAPFEGEPAEQANESDGGPGQANDTTGMDQQQTGDQLQVGAVDNATIGRMTVDSLTVERLEVGETQGGGFIEQISGFVSDILGGGNETDANETNDTAGEQGPATGQENETAGTETQAGEGGSLYVGNVEVSEMTVENMSVDRFERVEQSGAQNDTAGEQEPGVGGEGPAQENETEADGGPEMGAPGQAGQTGAQAEADTVLGTVTVESATVSSVNATVMRVQAENGAMGNATTPEDNATGQANESGNESGGLF